MSRQGLGVVRVEDAESAADLQTLRIEPGTFWLSNGRLAYRPGVLYDHNESLVSELWSLGTHII